MKFSVRAVDVARHLEIVKNHSCDYDEAGVYVQSSDFREK